MRVTLWALMGAGGNCHEHMQDTPLHFFAFSPFFHLQEVFAIDRFVSRRSSAHVFRSFAISCCFWRSFWASLLGGEPCSTVTQDTFTWFCLSLCCQIGPVFSVPLRHQTSIHRRHGLGILHRGMTAVYVMLINTFYRAFLQLQLSYQAMCLSFAREVDIENDELRVSVLFACSSVRYSGNDELRVCLVFLLFRSAPDEFFLSVMSRSRWRPIGWKRHSRTPSSC